MPRQTRAPEEAPGTIGPRAGRSSAWGCVKLAKRHRLDPLRRLHQQPSKCGSTEPGARTSRRDPHDTGGARKKNSSFLYNGTRTMYEREGFTYDRPKGQGNCVMVREVAPSTGA